MSQKDPASMKTAYLRAAELDGRYDMRCGAPAFSCVGFYSGIPADMRPDVSEAYMRGYNSKKPDGGGEIW